MKTFLLLISFLILLTFEVTNGSNKFRQRPALGPPPYFHRPKGHVRPAIGPPPYLHRPKGHVRPALGQKRPILRPTPKGPLIKMHLRQKRGAESIQCWQSVIFFFSFQKKGELMLLDRGGVIKPGH